jgi:RNA polymerase sigma-70 factor (ECF subfamily)
MENNFADARLLRKTQYDEYKESLELLTSLHQGCYDAYTEIYIHYWNPIFEFLYKLTRSYEVAEDITQNVFLGVWEKREKVDPARGIQRYLFTLAKCMAMRFFRQKKNEGNHNRYKWMQIIKEIAPDEHLFAKEFDLLVEATIFKMPKIRKLIFGMYYKEDLSYDQVADILGMNKATVANHLTHARNDIRNTLQIES